MRGMRYADDNALLSKNETGLENLITAVKEHSETKRLKFNAKEIKIFDIDTHRQSLNI